MDGGATVGNREIGSCVMDTPPNTSMNSAMTQAKTGRSMKNWAMNEPPYLPAAADAALGAAPVGALPPLPAPAAAGCHGTAFTARAALRFLETADHPLLTGRQAFEHDPVPVLCRADLDRTRRNFAVGA